MANSRRRTHISTLWLLGVLLATPSCRPLAAAASSPTTPKTAIPPNPDLLPDETKIEQEVREAERAEMVRPAPRGFKPEKAARRLHLTLVARDKSIKVGQTFWYRLELQNVGKEPIEIDENASFLKDGERYDDGTFDFFVTTAAGARELMSLGVFADNMTDGFRPNRPIDIPGGEKMSKDQLHAYMRLHAVRSKAEAGLHVILAPGETLVSRPWKWVSPLDQRKLFESGAADLWPKPEGDYRELWTEFDFDKPGRYTIQAEYVDEPPPPFEEWFLKRMENEGYKRSEFLEDYAASSAKRMGRVRSNPVSLEVVP